SADSSPARLVLSQSKHRGAGLACVLGYIRRVYCAGEPVGKRGKEGQRSVVRGREPVSVFPDALPAPASSGKQNPRTEAAGSHRLRSGGNGANDTALTSRSLTLRSSHFRG